MSRRRSPRPLAALFATTALAFASLAALACSSTVTPRPDVQVAVMGSSTAAGTGATAGNSWVDRVRVAAATACPQVKVTNLAVGGTTTSAGLPTSSGAPPAGREPPMVGHNLDAALALKPALVLVQYPSNDAYGFIPLAETLANHTIIRDGIRAAGASDVIIGPFPRTFTDAGQVALMTGLRDALPAVGAPRYIELWTELALSDIEVKTAYASADGVHLNDQGHALIADKVVASAAWKAICTP
jgi:lysophospholipase L1-like esterase